MIYFSIDKTIKKPIYEQIVEQVQKKIEDKSVCHLDMLPSEFQFASIYNVSSFVVKRAYKILESLGYLKRIQGKGTFLSLRQTYTPDAYNLQTVVMPFGSQFRKIVLSVDVVRGDYRINKSLNIEGDTRLKSYKFLMMFEDLPVSYGELYTLDDDLFDYPSFIEGNNPLIEYLKNTDLQKISYVVSLNVGSADKINAETLHIDLEDPILVAETTYFKSNKPCAYLMTLYPGEYTVIKAVDK